MNDPQRSGNTNDDTIHKGNLFFQVLVVSVSIFILTIFALIAAVIGESQAPIFRLINEQAGSLFLAEVVVILIACVLAMVIDRRQALRASADAKPSPGPGTHDISSGNTSETTDSEDSSK